jgi:hypothetical protein
MQRLKTTPNSLFDISSAGLHIIAMATMLIDHSMKTVIANDSWVFVLGRLAFPIFAFMAAEGCIYTRDYRKYMLRMLIFAILSEIPYDLMKSGVPFDSYDQNVLWTFLIAIFCIRIIEFAREQGRFVILVSICMAIMGFIAGTVFMTDYGGTGVIMVMIFYFLRERNWLHMLIQFILMCFINVGFLGALGYAVTIPLFGQELQIPMQGFAVLALIPIWLYHGRQGYHSKPFQYICYAFYPVHMVVLFVLSN